uniref:Secreted protein n=1 Tax=Cacopsylla melanoneura TaxID=428564 RepID=A0A8D8QIF0_9HEMI
MGLLLFIFPGHSLLHTTLAMETLGRGQNPCPHDGSGRGHLFRNREKTKEETTSGLLVGKPQVSQLVGVQILLVRVPVTYKCYRSNVPDEQILRRCLSHVRNRRDHIHGKRPGRQDRSDDLHLSSNDQMYILQVRSIRGG